MDIIYNFVASKTMVYEEMTVANLTKVSCKIIITPSNELRPKGFPFIRNKVVK